MKRLFVMLIIATMLVGCSGRIVKNGKKVGTVIKLHSEGFFFKTWEGEMVRGGMSNGSGGFSTTPLEFTINDQELLKKVQDALDNQYEVEVTYEEYFCYLNTQSSSQCLFLKDIKPLSAVQHK